MDKPEPRKEFITEQEIDEILQESFSLPLGKINKEQDITMKYQELVKFTKFITNTVKLAVEKHFLELRKIEDITMNLN